MPEMQTVCDFLEQFAPLQLAADWDNVGLLVGDAEQPVARIMTCLTITPGTTEEAVRDRANLIVTHHPLPFHSLKRLTTDTTPERLLWRLIRCGIAVYSPHTAFDSAAAGINRQLADGLELRSIVPLEPQPDAPENVGGGRWGTLPEAVSLAELAERLKQFLQIDGLHLVGALAQPVHRIAVACGAAGTFLPAAIRAGCDALVVGETNYHTCLAAEAEGVALLLPGHYASERFAVEKLARVLQDQFAEVETWASRDERDPLRWF